VSAGKRVGTVGGVLTWSLTTCRSVTTTLLQRVLILLGAAVGVFFPGLIFAWLYLSAFVPYLLLAPPVVLVLALCAGRVLRRTRPAAGLAISRVIGWFAAVSIAGLAVLLTVAALALLF
jgi:hypothetical protein